MEPRRPGELGLWGTFPQRGVCRNRQVQIPNASLGLRQHCVRDDNDSPFCHPERSEGSVHYVCRIRSGKLGFIACCSTHVAALIKRHVCRWPIVLWRLISAATIGWATRRCHPERSEGSVRFACRIHPDKLGFGALFAQRNVCRNRCAQIPHCVRDDSDVAALSSRAERGICTLCLPHALRQIGILWADVTTGTVLFVIFWRVHPKNVTKRTPMPQVAQTEDEKQEGVRQTEGKW